MAGVTSVTSVTLDPSNQKVDAPFNLRRLRVHRASWFWRRCFRRPDGTN
jgi:hypothetical protein